MMRHHVRMRTKLENGVLRNRQPTQSVVKGSSDQGEFEAMKTLSGWEAARCDEHHFRAKVKVVFKFSLFDKWFEKEDIKMALLLLHTFAFSCLPHGFWLLI